jgi:predicted RNase H-like HicB family nuclease
VSIFKRKKRPHFTIKVGLMGDEYIAEVVELPGCISCGDSLTEAIENVQDAAVGYLAVCVEDSRVETGSDADDAMYNGRTKARHHGRKYVVTIMPPPPDWCRPLDDAPEEE